MKNPVLFYDKTFPFAGERPGDQALSKLKEQFNVVGAEELAGQLACADVYIHLHGPFFPKEAWNAILAHVSQGKGLVFAGGAPFKIPVYQGNGKWMEEQEQTAYHQQLYINEALAVSTTGIKELRANADLPLFTEYESLFAVEPTYGLVLHVTRTDDHPGEMGSGGPMDAHIYPLLRGISGDGLQRELSAPAVLLEHTKGKFSGGRWIFVNQSLQSSFWQEDGVKALSDWAAFTAHGVTELWLKPNYGSYELGERCVLMLQGQRLLPAREQLAAASSVKRNTPIQDNKISWTFNFNVYKAKNSEEAVSNPVFIYEQDRFETVWQGQSEIGIGRELAVTRIMLPFEVEAGFYAIECEAVSSSGERRIVRQGFWGFDQELLAAGEWITCDRIISGRTADLFQSSE